MRVRNSNARKALRESQFKAIKSFDEVEQGDVGTTYFGEKVTIISKGPASSFSDVDGFEEFVDLDEYDPDDASFNDQIDAEWPECVLVEQDGEEVVYSYGSDGVQVLQNEARVRQISFDFIDDGVSERDLISRIQDAMDVAGITIVGGPAFGDTSWSKEEYGLSESAKKRSKRNLKEALLCGPTGSARVSLRNGTKFLNNSYSQFNRDEEEDEFDLL